MLGLGILSGLLIVPLCGAAFLLTLNGDEATVARNSRWAALATTVVTFLLSLVAWSRYDTTSAAYQLVESHPWLTETIRFKLGVDGFSMPLVLLTTLLMPICIGASWVGIQTRLKEYFVAFLVLETMMIGVFVSLDLVVLYLFFEGTLIPMFLIVGIWGSKGRIYATFKFFFFTLFGSVLMLLGVIAMYWEAGTTDIPQLLQHRFPAHMQTWLWLAFFAAFAVKLPKWPLHTWLLDAHVEAPTAGSVILAGVLLKMGGYGFIRISLSMLPLACREFAPLVFALAICAIIFASVAAMMQTDIKKLVAYSSVAHMGFVTLGLFTMTEQGIQGAWFLMISHGLVSSALFLSVGVLYDRMHTREIAAYGGLVKRMPLYAVAMMVFTMANVGLPGTSGFIGEFLAMVGAFKANPHVAFFAVFGIILSACYALWVYARVVFGKLEKPSLRNIKDLDTREMLMLGPLVALIIYYGVHPGPILDTFAPSTDALMVSMKAALSNTQTAAAALPVPR
ncbi:NADH-quinone oxidoreductase subunit M [Methylobacterium sp. NEAU 140]|uniref:NADH-quinone oxidoreductase subunit M n=1 Tax=Methylobacterium sp. NEAU 140 TaxID=3064945 RepID=UPI002735640C|nr:NADH-quinone oxidoreductase subunit M [Methylobacterium sp. NEAU 140]MDP4025619.1 NADH-quinone oxidoreductase subunit M [Methylobacterium sp. NEAU 140]